MLGADGGVASIVSTVVEVMVVKTVVMKGMANGVSDDSGADHSEDEVGVDTAATGMMV